jgi:hypothetical protein
MRPLLIAFPLPLACLLAAAIAIPAAAAEPGTRKRSDRGVTVAVTPLSLSATAKTWDFKVVLDTHSQDLGDDLVKSTVLLDDKGGRHLPVTWDGARPGGHHREGTLRFNAISPKPAAIELQIQRPGEAKARSFRWNLE